MNKKEYKNFKKDIYDKRESRKAPGTGERKWSASKGSKSFFYSGDPKDGFNDINWWNQNPQLLKDASNLSYGNIAGLNLNFNAKAIASASNNETQSIPGIMTLEFVPIVGVSKDGSSPVNNASRLVYAAVRHANSGSRNYEQSDLFTYYLAMSNILVAHAELTRLYGLTQVYAKTNRFVGKSLIEAMGYDFNDITNNIATLRYAINSLAVRINSFAIPKDIYLYARHIMLASTLFTDAKSVKAQLYAFKPRQYFQWSNIGPDGTPGSSLKPVMAPTYNLVGQVTVSQAVNFVTSLINAVAVNEDCGIMSGDTLKNFGDTGIYHLNAIPEDYAVIPVYDEVVLSQIHNAEIYEIRSAALESVADLWVTQNDNNIIYNPEVENGYTVDNVPISSISTLLDSGMDVPTPEFNMEATRFKGALELTDTGKYYFKTIGTEIITAARIYVLNNGVLEVDAVLNTWMSAGATIPPRLISGKFCFDWAPIQYLVAYNDVTDSFTVLPMGELFNYTIIDAEYIEKVNNAALLSVLNVYSLAMGKLNK